MKKFLKIIYYIFVISIFLLGLLVCSIVYIFSLFAYYFLIDSEQIHNHRYALYNNRGWDGDAFVIVQQDPNNKSISQLKTSSISHVAKDGDPNKYIYHFFPNSFDYTNPELNVINNRYLTLSFDGMHYFLYDTLTNKKYFEDAQHGDRQARHDQILEIIGN